MLLAAFVLFLLCRFSLTLVNIIIPVLSKIKDCITNSTKHRTEKLTKKSLLSPLVIFEYSFYCLVVSF